MESAAERIIKDVDKVLEGVSKAFEMMKTKDGGETPEGKKFRKGLRELVVEARRVMDGVGCGALEGCKGYK